ncbi:hypothetical protein PHSY_007105 [Pseudozyma hubeiensis SY62]|uniref:Uncharacterized protein n=1 Tax=Pseudozyma hubeiensis (strain SY62) TaxID=1305764 RepID=R9PDP0_PSEHS|nr:hypothetical protein PHSY_007105 [Pseudozyma hubeiensis SY62]GAC99503.1 hypothetical protein PHSY_007105 [Pseudozyma hubeiensis SY62]
MLAASSWLTLTASQAASLVEFRGLLRLFEGHCTVVNQEDDCDTRLNACTGSSRKLEPVARWAIFTDNSAIPFTLRTTESWSKAHGRCTLRRHYVFVPLPGSVVISSRVVLYFVMIAAQRM